MSPTERRRTIRRDLRGLAVVSVAWGLLAAALPASSTDRSVAWVTALSVVPWHSATVLGCSLVFAGFVGAWAVSPHYRREVVGLIGLALAASLWAIVAAAFAYAAVTASRGVGGGFAIVAAYLAWKHLATLYARR